MTGLYRHHPSGGLYALNADAVGDILDCVGPIAWSDVEALDLNVAIANADPADAAWADGESWEEIDRGAA